MGTTRVLGRWTAFNLVGFGGLAVQLFTVAVLVRLLHVHYLLATAIAVELAVLHNFAWHHRWTWRDRPPSSRRDLALRLARFHALNGLVSFAGNIRLLPSAPVCCTLTRFVRISLRSPPAGSSILPQATPWYSGRLR